MNNQSLPRWFPQRRGIEIIQYEGSVTILTKDVRTGEVMNALTVRSMDGPRPEGERECGDGRGEVPTASSRRW